VQEVIAILPPRTIQKPLDLILRVTRILHRKPRLLSTSEKVLVTIVIVIIIVAMRITAL
jgi:cell division protein FtsL